MASRGSSRCPRATGRVAAPVSCAGPVVAAIIETTRSSSMLSCCWCSQRRTRSPRCDS
ncbi:hypothetical protein PF005_g16748 [Phytophthora fragariae]|uniref:Uncharacterized protein n=1 Tax=Phytophthora fragariae TaxID=53985 RepID=A0A6A3JPJ6_9STRA|nr:hypothetical protein PF003_g21041 [Phytophthora fragariae]KAE8935657.1 hypothetical protein PF009_g14407 [Phytophthora fragariae]KAE8995397.1 hypothetical protein PF011_g16352 [Phytophthora fragariae]KAE9103088.1 hypothetical protein PF010_g13858 [Phytophthora fragariae]KAE9106301.1 hypothetical protein PF007_g13453 [Phytophthora fragariae]